MAASRHNHLSVSHGSLVRIVFLVFAALALASCGSSEDAVETSAAETEPTETQPVDAQPVGEGSDGSDVELGIHKLDIAEPISEQDLVKARATLNDARTIWSVNTPEKYVLEIGLPTISEARYTVVGGDVVEEEVIQAMPEDWGITIPQTVDELFVEIDTLITRFENDPSGIMPAGECGAHFNVVFEPETGYPMRYDTLGPCDDGVGVEALVIVDDA